MTEEVKNTEAPKTAAKRKPVQKWKYEESAFMTEGMFEDARGKYSRVVNKEQYNDHGGKCTHRVCKELGINHDHLDMCYAKLNGRKLDGFYINEMIDRYGYQGAPNLNRAALSAKYGKITRHLEVAFEKLKGIVHNNDPLESFMKYQKEYEDVLLKTRRDKVVDGE